MSVDSVEAAQTGVKITEPTSTSSLTSGSGSPLPPDEVATASLAAVVTAIESDPPPASSGAGVSVIQFAPPTSPPYKAEESNSGASEKSSDDHDDRAARLGNVCPYQHTPSYLGAGSPWRPRISSPRPTAESSLIRAEYLQNYLRRMYAIRNTYTGRRGARMYSRYPTPPGYPPPPRCPPPPYPTQPTNRTHPYHPRPSTRLSVPTSTPLPRLPWQEAPESEWQTVNINFMEPYGVRTWPSVDQQM